MRYDIKADQLDTLYEAVQNEINKSFKDRLVNFETMARFD